MPYKTDFKNMLEVGPCNLLYTNPFFPSMVTVHSCMLPWGGEGGEAAVGRNELFMGRDRERKKKYLFP
jgi:hypothetical protein